VFRKKVNRKQLVDFFSAFHACTVVMEACAGAHHMARKLASFRHQVKLISPQHVRPFVKSNKNDFVDAEAICEAASRPAMRFVTPKTESQQTLSALHRVRPITPEQPSDITNRREVVTLDLVVMREQYDSLGNCLAKKESVERVTMKRRQGGDLECVLRLDGEFFIAGIQEAAAKHPCVDLKIFPAERALDDDLPHARYAEIQCVIRIFDDHTGLVGQRRMIRRNPYQ